AALVAMPFFLIDALYTRGAFTLVDAHATAGALLQYGWGVPAFVLQQLVSRVFFASQDTKTPMRYALVSVALNVVAGLALFQLIGVPGIAAATSLASWVNVAMMTTTLLRRGLYVPQAKAVSRLLRIMAASAVLGLVLGAASHYRDIIQGLFAAVRLGPLGPKEFSVAIVSMASAALYPALLFASGGLTPADVRYAFRRRKGEAAAPVIGEPPLG
uniref:lipid II flippase MurJ n=1 Tax=Phenylobacterium aquaticum TaxID=1763816 RepID=UPI0026EC37FD